MEPAALYPALRHLHISLVLVSGAFFALRGQAVLRGQAWPMRPGVRRLSYGIDTALLAAALGLLALLDLNPFTTPWLTTKIALLLLYIVLGTLALKRARTPEAKRRFFIAALACYGFMLSVAVTRSPLGALRWLGFSG